MNVSPRSAISLIRQQISCILPPPIPPPVSPYSPPYSPTPPRFNMASAIKFLVFKRVGNEDLDQFWFVVKAIREAQGVVDDNIKKATLVSVLQDRELTWYIKHFNDNPNARIMDIQAVLNM